MRVSPFETQNIFIKKEIFMKKITKTLVAILLIAIMSMTNVVAFAADEGVSPRLSHMENGGFSFAVTDNVGYIGVTYYGYDSFVRADLNVKVQKRFLLVFWDDVYEWDASSTEKNGQFYLGKGFTERSLKIGSGCFPAQVAL